MTRSHACALTVLACSSFAWAGEAPRTETDRPGLRAALKLPAIEMQAGWNYSMVDGFSIASDPPNHSEELARLERSLAGTDLDAEPLLRMAALTDDAVKAEAWGRRAESLLRTRLAEHPDDVSATAGIVQALVAQGRLIEAEAEARSLLDRDPADGSTWLSLARIIEGRLFPEPTPGDAGSATAVGPESFDATLKSMLADGTLPKFEERLAEARSAYDRSVEYSADPYDALCERGAFRAFREATYRCAVREARGEGGLEDCPDMWPLEAADDFLAAADLRRGQIEPLAMYLLYQLQALLMKGLTFDTVPEERRVTLLAAEKRLLDAAAGGGSQAAAALFTVGIAEGMFLDDPVSAEKHLRQSIKLDPARQEAWDTLIGVMVIEERFANIADLGPELLKHRASSRSRLIVAKAAALVGRIDDATEQLRIAVREEPSFTEGHLGLAALALMAEDSPAALRRALLELEDAERLAGPEVAEPLRSDMNLVRGIWLALDGDLAGARQALAAVADGPARDGAAQALSALRAE